MRAFQRSVVGRLASGVAVVSAFGAMAPAAAETATVAVEVTFVDSVAIGETSSGRASDPADETSVAVASNGTADIADATNPATAAELAITTTAGREVTIYVDPVVSGTGFGPTDFLCSYGPASDVPCAGDGFVQPMVASGTLRIAGAELADATEEGVVNASVEVTLAYQ